MATQTTKRVIEEGFRNAVVNLTGVLDTSNVSLAPAIALSDFTNNDNRAGVLSGFRVDRIDYSIGSGIEIQLLWHGDSPALIAAIAGRGNLNYWHNGGLQPDQTVSGYSGGIDLVTTGYPSGSIQNYVIQIELIKLYKNQ